MLDQDATKALIEPKGRVNHHRADACDLSAPSTQLKAFRKIVVEAERCPAATRGRCISDHEVDLRTIEGRLAYSG